MIEFSIDSDENIVQEFDGAIWFSDNHRELEKLILTDKGLYCIYSIAKDWSGNDKGEEYRFNISDIVVKDGVSMICKAKIRQTSCLQIQFRHGMEYFGFFENASVKIGNLMKAINQLLGAKPFITPKEGTFNCYCCGSVLPNGANYCFYCGKKTVREEKKEDTSGRTYYFVLEGQTNGPFNMAEVHRLVESGKLKRDTLAWTKTMKDWKPLEQIPELMEFISDMPPAL